MAGKFHRAIVKNTPDKVSVLVRNLGGGYWQGVTVGKSQRESSVYRLTTGEAVKTFMTVRKDGLPVLASDAESAQAERIVSKYYGG